MTTLAALCALLSPSVLAQPEPATGELVSSVTSVQPGQPFWVALRLRMEEGWHTYWRNPGDSGQATRVTWQLPTGWKADAPLWPVPKRYVVDGLTSFGYEGEVLLPIRLTPPVGLRPGTDITLKGQARWLVCSDVCLPGGADLSLTLPVRGAVPGPHPTLMPQILATVGQIPKSDATLRPITATRVGKTIQLDLPPSVAPAQATLDFFPHAPAQLDHGKEPKVERFREVTRLTLGVSEFASAPPTRLDGTLVVRRNGLVVRAVTVTVPVSSKK